MKSPTSFVTLALCLLPSLVSAFVAPTGRLSSSLSSSALSMAPRFDKKENRWITTKPEDSAEFGYDIWGTVIRHGPLPFFNRIFRADEYEQGVLKFMAGDKVDRNTAQAEMDAYLNNPNDWAYNRLKGYNVDYLKINTKQVVLNTVWSVLIIVLLSRGVYCLSTGENYWAIIGKSSKPAWCEVDGSCILDALNMR